MRQVIRLSIRTIFRQHFQCLKCATCLTFFKALIKHRYQNAKENINSFYEVILLFKIWAEISNIHFPSFYFGQNELKIKYIKINIQKSCDVLGCGTHCTKIYINFQIYGTYVPHASQYHGNSSTDPQSKWMHYLHTVLHFNLNYLT
jgi:hypothetical protein